MSAHETGRLAQIEMLRERHEHCDYKDVGAYDGDGPLVAAAMAENERLRGALLEAGELFDEIKDNNWSIRIGRLETIAAWLHWYHQTPGGEDT